MSLLHDGRREAVGEKIMERREHEAEAARAAEEKRAAMERQLAAEKSYRQDLEVITPTASMMSTKENLHNPWIGCSLLSNHQLTRG